MNCIVFLFGLTFIVYISLIFFPKYLMFGAFEIKTDSITLGEIGGFIGGILSPLAFLMIFLTLKSQQEEFYKGDRRYWDLLMAKIQDDQPKLVFKYDSYTYDQDKFELSFNFLIINVGKDARNFGVSRNFSSNEDDLVNFLDEPPLIDHLPNYVSDQKTILKLAFRCINEDSIEDILSIELFFHYSDISQVNRAFYADFRVIPRSDIGYQAEIRQREHAI